MDENKNGRLILRIKAIFIDLLVLAGFGLAATKIFSMIGDVSDNVRLVVFNNSIKLKETINLL